MINPADNDVSSRVNNAKEILCERMIRKMRDSALRKDLSVGELTEEAYKALLGKSTYIFRDELKGRCVAKEISLEIFYKYNSLPYSYPKAAAPNLYTTIKETVSTFFERLTDFHNKYTTEI